MNSTTALLTRQTRKPTQLKMDLKVLMKSKQNLLLTGTLRLTKYALE
jgi:hypothetical protein